MHDEGVIHGRFQVLHKDHLAYLLDGKSRCRRLIVGITNPDPRLTADDAADPHRSRPDANPLTYYERHTLVHAVLDEAGLAPADFTVVPFPINFPGLYHCYVPLAAMFFVSVYDAWGRKKLERFRELGLRTEVLSERPIDRKGISATDVRARMAGGEPWEDLVPPAARRLLLAWDIPERLRRLREAQGHHGQDDHPDYRDQRDHHDQHAGDQP
jgi:nicotinamide mononucleotide adenylyltransferase